MDKLKSNYEKQVLLARELFLKYDQEKMKEKFHLQSDEGYLYLPFLDESYRISRQDGRIEKRICGIYGQDGRIEKQICEFSGQDGRNEKQSSGDYAVCMDYNVVMTIYDILCCSRGHPVLSGEWCRLSSLQVTGSSPSTELVTGRYAKKFSGRAKQLRQACEALHGEFRSVPASADACYQIPLFPFFSVILQFWDGDEEFAPRIVILWDKNALQFLHFETLYYAMGHLLERLSEASEKEKDGR